MKYLMRLQRNGNRQQVLLNLLTGLYLALIANTVIGAPNQGEEKSGNVIDQVHLNRTEINHVTKRNKVISVNAKEAPQFGTLNEHMEDYGHLPLRALQIPGHVLQAITSNMGTELITID